MTAPSYRRVAVFRSSRHLALAVVTAQSVWPGCAIAVVHQPGRALEARILGVPIEYGATARFRVLGWVMSSARRTLRAWAPDEIVVQFQDESGAGCRELGLVALLAGRGRFHAVLPDGSLHTVDAWGWLRAAARAAALAGRNCVLLAAIAAASILAAPVWMLSRGLWALRDRELIGRGDL
ncbi:MAG: hypothetical protein AB1635_07900 [Acidobacteriota bacterium]